MGKLDIYNLAEAFGGVDPLVVGVWLIMKVDDFVFPR